MNWPRPSPYIRQRLCEASTWAAIGAALGTLGTQIPAPYSFAAFGLAACCGIAAALIPDKDHQPPA
jgi:hypothetical protein